MFERGGEELPGEFSGLAGGGRGGVDFADSPPSPAEIPPEEGPIIPTDEQRAIRDASLRALQIS